MGTYTRHAEAEWTTMTHCTCMVHISLPCHGPQKLLVPDLECSPLHLLSPCKAIQLTCWGGGHDIAVHQVLVCGRCCSPMQAKLALPEPCQLQGVPGSCKSQWL